MLSLLMITCPHTRRPIPTNKVAPPGYPETGDTNIYNVRCPYCRANHSWTMQQTFPAGTRPRRASSRFSPAD